MIVHWSKGIEEKGGIRNQYHHITDIAPTTLDVTGTTFFKELDGVEQMDLDGTSMQYAFNKKEAPTTHKEQYYELFGKRAIYSRWLKIYHHTRKQNALEHQHDSSISRRCLGTIQP